MLYIGKLLIHTLSYIFIYNKYTLCTTARYGTILGTSHIGVFFKVNFNDVTNIETAIKRKFAPLRFNDNDTELFLKNIITYEEYGSERNTKMLNIIPQVIKVR
jgi:hypothetical protein